MAVPFSTLWTDVDGERYFLIAATTTLAPGEFVIKPRGWARHDPASHSGHEKMVDPRQLTPFEITEDQARRIAKDQLGEALGELKDGIDKKLAEWREELEAFKQRPVTELSPVTPEAGPALLDFLKQLPRIIGQSLSGEETRVDTARGAMAKLQQRLREAGIEVDDRFGQFADRLAGLREDVAKEKRGSTSECDEPRDGS